MARAEPTRVLVHAHESCLRNAMEPPNPGGNGAVIEAAWHWVEGHAGHAKNEYANCLATRAAARQGRSDGLLGSGFAAWLARHRAAGRYADYDPDRDVHERV